MSAMADVFLTAFFLFLTWLLLIGIRYVSFVRRLNKLPGPGTNPITEAWRALWTPRDRLIDAFDKQNQKYAPIYRTWVGLNGMVHLTRPEHVAVILGSNKFLNKPNQYKFLGTAVGKGLITAQGKIWQTQRLLIAPTFHIRVINSYHDVFVKSSQALLETLSQYSGKEAFNVQPFLMQFTLEAIFGAAMNVNPREKENLYSLFLEASSMLYDMTLKHSKLVWNSLYILFKLTAAGKRFTRNQALTEEFINKVIREFKSALSCNNKAIGNNTKFDEKKKNTYIELLLQNENSMTDYEIKEHVRTFLTSGYETTLNSLCWTLFLLGSHMEVQEKVYEELQNIFHGSDRDVVVNDLQKMKYLEQVIQETLRLYPVAPIILRKAEEDVQLGGYVIPAGVMISIDIYHLHRCVDQFPEPEKFNPDNFLPEKVEARHPFSYIPFSAGSRSCLGKRFTFHEQKTVISSILRKYKLYSTQTRENVTPIRGFTIRPKHGLWIKFEERC